MRILHNGKDALTVAGSTPKAVEEVGQAVFVQGTRHKHPHRNGDQNGNGIGEDLDARPQRGRHQSSCQPPCQWPMLHHGLITGFRRFMQPPKRQAGKEDKCCPNTVVKPGLFHFLLHILGFHYAKVQKISLTLQTEKRKMKNEE